MKGRNKTTVYRQHGYICRKCQKTYMNLLELMRKLKKSFWIQGQNEITIGLISISKRQTENYACKHINLKLMKKIS